MALQASGPISASDISKEFGPTKNISFGAYRVSKTPTGTDLTLPLDAGIPGPGQSISFSDFYSKRLNIVVKCARTDEIKTRVTARKQYDDNDDLAVIGGFKGRPQRTGGKKVWIHTNGTIGSNKSNVDSNKLERTHCSLIVGEWENNTTLKVDVGDKGIITGSGGGGGKGGSANGKNAFAGADGFHGTSALGISHVNNAIVISNRGRIQEGGGGGGGGGAAWNQNKRRNERDVIFGSGGSGGGGGRGYPEGPGGERGSGIKSGTSGKKGKLKLSGNGGVGVKDDDNRTAGGGGGGGGAPDGDHGDGGGGIASGGTGQDGDGGHGGKGGNGGAFGGTDGRTANPDMKGGLGGLNGFALVVNGSGSNVSITGNGLLGNQINNTKPQ